MFGVISPPRELLPSIIIIIIIIIIIFIFIIIIIIIIIIQKERLHNAVYKFTKDGCHYVWRAQTALIHYTRGPADWLTL